jgi:hypothetical protein
VKGRKKKERLVKREGRDGKGKGRAHLFACRLLRYGRGAIGPRQARASLEPARLTLALLFLLTRSGLLILLILLLLARTNSLKARLDPIHDPPNRRWRLRVRHALLDHLEQVGAGRSVARVVRALRGRAGGAVEVRYAQCGRFGGERGWQSVVDLRWWSDRDSEAKGNGGEKKSGREFTSEVVEQLFLCACEI